MSVMFDCPVSVSLVGYMDIDAEYAHFCTANVYNFHKKVRVCS